MACNAFTSWEIQDNLKLRSVVSEKVVTSKAAETPNDKDKSTGVKLSDIGVPEHCVTLRPFLHPELTDASRDACELRLHCEPHHNLSIRSITVVATARNTELYDRKGEYLQTVRGLNIPGSDWYRFLYTTAEPCYEIKLKFLSLMHAGLLMLGNAEVHLESHAWPAQLAVDASAQSVPSLLERLSEVELSPHARSVLNLLCAANHQQQQQQQQQQKQQHHHQQQQQVAAATAAASATSSAAAQAAAIAGLRVWLEQRLDAMERRLDERLTRIEARLLLLDLSGGGGSEAATPHADGDSASNATADQ